MAEREGASGQADNELLARARAGDEAAFQEIVGRYRERIVRLAWRFVEDREESLDVAQEVFVALYLKLPTWDAGVSVPAWLSRVAVNKAVERARKMASQRRLARESARLTPKSAVHEPPGEDGAANPEVERVRHAMRRLSSRQQAVVQMHFFDRLSIDAVGKALGMTANNVRVTLHKSLKAIRRIVGS